MPAPRPLVAVVMPVFNEEEVLPQTFARLTALFDGNPTIDWRAVLVNDGSRDRTPELLSRQNQTDPRFEVVEFTRNFGFQAALAAGIAHATYADAMVTMDADLQDPPELIPQLIEEWKKGSEVVLAVRRSRQETGLKRVGMDVFHGVFRKLTDMPLISNNAGTFGLMDRQAAEAFSQLTERHRFFPGLRAWIGFRVAEVSYDRASRAAGEPQQSFRRLARYALDGVFSFSYLPLRLLVVTGCAIAVIGFMLAMFFAIRRILGIEIAETGFTTLVILVLLLGGGQLVGIGVLGEYLGRIYDEVKRRPLYVVKQRKDDRK